MKKKGLDPRIDEKTVKVMILGSFPGEESFKKKQYYANKRNQFWEVIFEVLGENLPTSYKDRIKLLNRAGIGLWDVIASCYRKGSTDQKIKKPVLNDLEILNGFPKLKGIFFNGRTAENMFKKHYEVSGLEVEYLASTSPLNTKNIEYKLKCWRAIKGLLKS